MCINISGVRTAWKMVPTAPTKTIEKIEKTKKKTKLKFSLQVHVELTGC